MVSGTVATEDDRWTLNMMKMPLCMPRIMLQAMTIVTMLRLLTDGKSDPRSSFSSYHRAPIADMDSRRLSIRPLPVPSDRWSHSIMTLYYFKILTSITMFRNHWHFPEGVPVCEKKFTKASLPIGFCSCMIL